MEVVVILVNWNQPKITLRCVASLFHQTRPDDRFSFRVIIVDNGSDPNLTELLERSLDNSLDPGRIQLIKNPENKGFAGGNNIGIKFALENFNPDFIWLLNNDIIVQDQALNKLVEAARKYPEPKIWGSTIYETYPELHFYCAGGFSYDALLSIPRPVVFPARQPLPTGLFHPLPKMDYPAGASMFAKAEIFRESGLMSEVYFLYYEELDLVRQIGGKAHIAWCPASVVHHQAGKSTGSSNPNKGRGSRIAHYYGNLSALKYTWLYHRSYFPVVFLFRLASKLFLFTIHGDFGGFPPLFNAYRDFFKWKRDYSKEP